MAEEVELLICKCTDCTHWEIGRTAEGPVGTGFLLCKTCGLSLPLIVSAIKDSTLLVLDDHHMLHWAKHER